MLNKVNLLPDIYIEKLNDLNLSKLNIKLLMIDIDNTIVAPLSNILSSDVGIFIDDLKKANIIPVFVSNNVKNRVKYFGELFDVDYYWFSLKPFSYNYFKILKKYGFNSNEIGCLGDQIITDIFGGKLFKFKTILIKPLVTNENVAGKVTRYLEKYVFEYLESKYDFKRGKYYE